MEAIALESRIGTTCNSLHIHIDLASWLWVPLTVTNITPVCLDLYHHHSIYDVYVCADAFTAFTNALL